MTVFVGVLSGKGGVAKTTSVVNMAAAMNYFGRDVVIVDSAGRSALDPQLSDELGDIDKVFKADEKLLVMSADIGQSAQKQADEFDKIVGLTGVVVTKMDSSAKGGGVLSACHTAGVKVYLIGTGEKVGDIEFYDPVRFVSRLLGMGDIEALLEKAKEAIEPEDAMDMLKSGDLNFDAFCKQMEAVGKMGSLDKILDMLPFGNKLNIPKGVLDVQQDKMKNWKIIITSMTKEERKDSELFKKSRRSRFERIAKGSGKSLDDVRELYAHFNKTKKMLRQMKGLKDMGDVSDGKVDENKMKKLMSKMLKGKMGF